MTEIVAATVFLVPSWQHSGKEIYPKIKDSAA